MVLINKFRLVTKTLGFLT